MIHVFNILLGTSVLRTIRILTSTVAFHLSRIADAQRDDVSAVGVSLEVGVSALSDAGEQVPRL